MFNNKIAIDLGTCNSLVYLRGKGVVLTEPSVVAISLSDNKILAVGELAKEMIGRTPADIKVYRPLKDGVIADFKRGIINTSSITEEDFINGGFDCENKVDQHCEENPNIFLNNS